MYIIICTHWQMAYMSKNLGSAADFIPLYSFCKFGQISVPSISTEFISTYLETILPFSFPFLWQMLVNYCPLTP